MELTEYYEESLRLHALRKGKLEIVSKVELDTNKDLALAYAPGVAEPCMLIAQDPINARVYSIKANTIAVVSDGSSVLGLGNIGGLAALPMAEGKALLYKAFGGVDAFPVCLDTQDIDEIVNTIKNIAPVFGGISLENIAGSRCHELVRRLGEELDIPVFHEGLGTAVTVAAAVINAYRVSGKSIGDERAVVCGAGAAGNAVAKILAHIGVRDIVVCDSEGILNVGRFSTISSDKIELLEFTNKDGLSGGLAEAVRGRGLFIGVSKPGVLTESMAESMSADAVLFALASPAPELSYESAKAAGARIAGTDSSACPNHINNALAFPGIFRGVLDAGAAEISQDMLLAAAYALAAMVPDDELTDTNILPDLFAEETHKAVASAVFAAWAEKRSD